MNRFVGTLLISLLGAATLSARAQGHRYAVIEYMHLPEGDTEKAYLATEKLWQRLHQKAVDAGICQAWFLDKVENGGRGDYVTIRIYNSLDKMADPWPDSITKNLFNAEEAKTIENTGKTRQLIRREVWEFESSAIVAPDDPSSPSTYAWIQFMKPKEGKSGDYSTMEKESYTKVHRARIKAGQMLNWHFLSRLFPSGTDSEYDFITINVFAERDWKWDPKVVESALGKEEAAKLGEPTAMRTMVREELWRPVMRAFPGQK